MKRILALSISLIFILVCFPLGVFASSETVISGEQIIICNGADTLELAGNQYKASQSIPIDVLVTVTDCGTEFSSILLNDRKIAKLSEGVNKITINSADLISGENEIKIVVGTKTSEYNNDVYGSVNLDDITINSVEFAGAGLSTPAKVNLYMPTVGSADITVKESAYTPNLSVGDGWFADTGLGGSSPNVPVYVGFVFECPVAGDAFSVDTTVIDDGNYTAKFTNNGSTVETRKYTIDNTAPVVKFSHSNGANVSRLEKVTFSVNDATKVDTALYVDGELTNSINTKELAKGNHTAIVFATDAVGNVSKAALNFNVTNQKYSITDSDKNLNISVLGNGTVYSTNLIKEIYMYENRLGEVNQGYLRSSDEVLISFDHKAEHETLALGESLPYQSFVINTKDVDEEEIMVSYTGTTGNGSGIVLKAWNYKTKEWDVLGSTPSGVPITVSVKYAEYSRDDKMRVNAMPDIVYNGSNSILWNSDTQYYSHFDNLNYLYYEVNEYAVDLYNSGDIGYCVHTGDLIDRTDSGEEIALHEYGIADKAQSILDDANVPNGVVSGNHDVFHSSADYKYYYQYFGEDRYNKFPWYGGSLNNNMHHYDLVSIGAYDFVFMYLGNYMEAEDDTIAWANAVCKAYPNRNVIICTHEYILPSGQYSGDRAEVIWDEIIVPNENVVMILCGHNEGVCDQMHQVGDSDRYVLEILADYQYANLDNENGNGILNEINGYSCDGEGFVRLMTFNDAGQLISTTYSPVADQYNYYPSYLDSFVYDVDLIAAKRSITTSEFNVSYGKEAIGKVGEELNLKSCEAFYIDMSDDKIDDYSEIYVLQEYSVDYKPDSPRRYDEIKGEKVNINGYYGVSENFRYNEQNVLPDSKLVEMNTNLLPTNKDYVTKSSGNDGFSVEINDRGGMVLSRDSAAGNNWTTVYDRTLTSKMVNFDEYNRLYFGVTADRNTKWNILIICNGIEINFSQNDLISSQFGYLNSTPSDITGTFSGYIDLNKLGHTGNKYINSVYLTIATPGESVTFDYLFLGKANGSSVRFITDEGIAIAYEGLVGESIDLPDKPYKIGYDFVGWYTEKEGGVKIENSVKVADDVTEVYARFSKRVLTKRNVTTYDTEVEFPNSTNITLIIIIAVVVVIVSASVVFVIFKKKNLKGNK